VKENGRGGFGLYFALADATYDCIEKVHVRSGRVDIALRSLDEVTAARILTLLKLREEATPKIDFAHGNKTVQRAEEH